jgi:ABC-type uncharacterized transport system fused permease/ATPase subunit
MDPEQRLTTDIRKFAINLSEVITDVASPAVDIVWYSVLLWRALGTRGVAPLWAYALFGIGLMKMVRPRIILFGSVCGAAKASRSHSVTHFL